MKKSKSSKSKKKKNKIDNQIEKKEKEIEALYIEDVLPIVDYNDELDILVMSDGTYCDFLEITTSDLTSLSEDELSYNIMLWEKLYKIYAGNLKIISFSFPTDTEQQQKYLRYKILKTDNPIYRRVLEEKLEKAEEVAVNHMTRSFALVFYAKSISEYRNNYLNIRAVLSNVNRPLIKVMSKEKKLAIIEKLCNKNFTS